MKFTVSATASGDLSEAFAYIGADSVRNADRFLQSARETFLRLAEMPGMGRIYGQPLAGGDTLRVWHVKGFENWLIFYRPVDGGIEVIRVLHGARDLDSVLEEDA